MSIYRLRDYSSEYRRNAQSGIVSLLNGQESTTVPDFDAANILLRVPPPVVGSVVDVGCGSATMLRSIAEDASLSNCRLNGVLPSTEEVELAQDLLKGRADWSRISVVLGDSTSIPLADGSQDCVYMNQMFHYLSQEIATSSLREVRRVLRPGGTLFIGALPERDEFEHLKQDHSALSWFNANVLQSSNYRQRVIDSLRCLRYAFTGRPFVQLMRTPYFCAPPEFRALLHAEGFSRVESTPYMILDNNREAVEHACRWDYVAIR
jgi:ubiquinone/menaquinone biosynthesis C-methylase UbiE